MSITSHWKWCAVIPSVRNHFGLIIQCHIVHCYVSQEVSYCKTVLYQHTLVLCLRLQPFWSSLSGNRRFISNIQWKKLMKLLCFSKCPFAPDKKSNWSTQNIYQKAYFEYNLQHRISFTNNSLQGHNGSTKMNLETKGSIRKKKNLTW